jgi:hypothetical protein
MQYITNPFNSRILIVIVFFYFIYVLALPLFFVFVFCVLGINPEVMLSVVAKPLTSAIGTDNILALGFNPRIKSYQPLQSAIGTTYILALGFNPRIKSYQPLQSAIGTTYILALGFNPRIFIIIIKSNPQKYIAHHNQLQIYSRILYIPL